jgi:hypothetical protein
MIYVYHLQDPQSFIGIVTFLWCTLRRAAATLMTMTLGITVLVHSQFCNFDTNCPTPVAHQLKNRTPQQPKNGVPNT